MLEQPDGGWRQIRARLLRFFAALVIWIFDLLENFHNRTKNVTFQAHSSLEEFGLPLEGLSKASHISGHSNGQSQVAMLLELSSDFCRIQNSVRWIEWMPLYAAKRSRDGYPQHTRLMKMHWLNVLLNLKSPQAWYLWYYAVFKRISFLIKKTKESFTISPFSWANCPGRRIQILFDQEEV